MTTVTIGFVGLGNMGGPRPAIALPGTTPITPR